MNIKVTDGVNNIAIEVDCSPDIGLDALIRVSHLYTDLRQTQDDLSQEGEDFDV